MTEKLLVQRKELAIMLGISLSSLKKLLEADRTFPKPVTTPGLDINLYRVEDIKKYVNQL